MSNSTRSLYRFSIYKVVAIAMICLVIAILIPAPVGAAMLRTTDKTVREGGSQIWTWLMSALSKAGTQRSSRERRGVSPLPAQSRAQLEAKVANLELNVGSEIELKSQQRTLLSAVPLDGEGNTVQGLTVEWRSSNKEVVFIRNNGEALAGKVGTATLLASAGTRHATVRVTVIDGSQEPYGGKKRLDSTRGPQGEAVGMARPLENRSAQNRNRRNRAHAARKLPTISSVAPFIRPPNDDPLPDNETTSLYQPNNLIGAPPGKKKQGALTAASAVPATENGNRNFSFGIPIVGLGGRGLDVSLSLIYNSLLWHKSTNPSNGSTWMTYDVDSGFPAEGFRLGYGQIEDQGSSGFTLMDDDGTRHALVFSSQFNYDTTDGSFIHFTGGSGWGTLSYPDGTRVGYGAAGGGFRSYPTSVMDRNGNYILISYVNDVGPRISTIQDTLGRYVRFYYNSSNELVTVTTPGLTGQADLQGMRFYYETLTLPSGLFAAGINVDKPATARVIRYVYLPASAEGSSSSSGDIGYRFDYSQYGMIYQVVKFQGMTASTTSTSSTGTVTEGTNTQAAITTYNYPTTASGLSDVPMFSQRTDDWAGRTNGGSAPQFGFTVNEGTTDTTTTVTAPDSNTVGVTVSIKNTGAWNDGLIKETRVQNSSSVVFRKTQITWEQNPTNGTPRVANIRVTNEAGKTNATVFSYDSTTPYNNTSVVSEREFTTNETVSSTELRRIETTYVTSSDYLNRRLLHLPSMIKVFPGGSSTPISRIDYAYDQYGSSHENMTPRDDIIMHDWSANPFAATEESCDWVCYEYDPWWVNCIDLRYECTYYNPYDPATDYRGNITTVTTYPDATTTTGAITHTTKYDRAGNVTTTQVDCCQSQSFTYSSANHDYAYPISITKGNPSGLHLTTSISYDMNTGLVSKITDPNSREFNFYYNSDTLRTDYVSFPDGGQISYDYFNALAADSASRYHFSIVTSTKLDSTRYLDTKHYFDGRGALTQTYDGYTSGDGWSVTDV